MVAVGNPFNLGGTATAGIVSALGRPNVSGSSYVDYMQIDAPINRGNSGGPTFDVHGRVVGVNAAIFSPSGGSVGIGFDIPADVAARVTRQLIAEGKVTRGFIGATVQDVTPEIAESLDIAPRTGALVAEVTADGPAARAGLQPGDIVLAVGGQAIHSAAELTRRVALARPGERLDLRVRRSGRVQTLVLVSGERPSPLALADGSGAAHKDAVGLGLVVAPAPGGGLQVMAVDPRSDAAARGLRPGDVIRKASGREVGSVADVIAAVRAARTGRREHILLQVRRAGRDFFVPLQTPPAQG